MKAGVILFQSKYSATQKYAQWLAEELKFDCIETKHADVKTVEKYDTIILGGGIYASGIAGLSFLRKNYSAFQGKKVAVFCVGASPFEDSAFRQIVDHNFKGAIAGIPCFYCRGAWDEEKMTFGDRTLCKIAKSCFKKRPCRL